MKIRNKNFICDKMQKRDIKEAFYFETDDLMSEIYALIGEGYLRKEGDRFFCPTEKLLDEAFLPQSRTIFLDDVKSRFLSHNSSFYRGDLVSCFDGNERIVAALIKKGVLRLEHDKRYRKSSEFEELLAEGGDTIKL